MQKTKNKPNNFEKRIKLENSHFPVSKLTINYNNQDNMVLA